MMKNAFYFTLKALFVLKIFKFLFQNLWCQNLVNKQLQHTYWPISHEVKQGNKVMKLGQLYGNIWKLITCFYVISSHFLKEGDSTSLLVLLPYFCMIFQEMYFSCYILIPDQISLSGSLYFLKYWVICVL